MKYGFNHIKLNENCSQFLGCGSTVFDGEENFVVPMLYPAKKRKAPPSLKVLCFLRWAQLGLNQRPPDYESGAANQLSYGPKRK